MAAPANYDFSGTRGITTIDPIRNDSRDSDSIMGTHDDGAKDGKEEDNKSVVIEGNPVVIERPEVSREELERVFRRAAIPSIALTLVVMVVSCFYGNFQVGKTAVIIYFRDLDCSVAHVFFALHIRS